MLFVLKRTALVLFCLGLISCRPAQSIPVSGAQVQKETSPAESEPTRTPALDLQASAAAAELSTQTAAAIESLTAASPTGAVTASSEPTSTATATQIPPLAVTSSGFNAWCIPETAPYSTIAWPMPTDAGTLQLGETGFELIYPARACAFEFTFNQAAPAGIELRVYEIKNNPAQPWLSVPLQAGSSANTAYAVLTHTYITNPPFWKISYRFSVESQDGSQQYWSNPILMKRNWMGRTCWNGKIQNPVTLACDAITYGDRHPTDWGYFLPTPTPGGDPAEGYFLK
jgi:hypothetical protein